MKTRSGFVSNSSSSSFVVEVPRDFKVTHDMLLKLDSYEQEELIEMSYPEEADEDDIDWDNLQFSQKAIDAINADIDSLKHGGSCYRGYGGTNLFWAVKGIMSQQNFIVMTLDGPGGDGEDIITAFHDERKKK